MTRFAINGFGRIGRSILRAWYSRQSYDVDDMECVVINCGNFADLATNVHLLKYDSTHGVMGDVSISTDGNLLIGDKEIKILFTNDIGDIDWARYNVDVVLECTGKFTTRLAAGQHLASGADKVVVSAPCKDADATVVYGVNNNALQPMHKVISIGSCTTNCLAPIAKLMHENFGIEHGFMTTVHAYTNDQMLVDGAHKDPRRARAATLSMIPTSTGAAEAIGSVLPELAGKLYGHAIRVPVPNVSLLELTVSLVKPVTTDLVNMVMKDAAAHAMSSIMAYNQELLVSVDFNHNSKSCVFDATQSQVIGNGKMCKVSAWYDNEWAFANRMLDVLNIL